LLAVCAIPFALAQRNKQSKQIHEALGAGSPVVQQKFKSSAVGSGNEKFMVRMMPATLPGPVSFGGIELPARVRALLPSVNVLIYFETLGFTNGNVIQVFRSTDNGATWLAPVNGTPGGASEDKEWITVDNFVGSGNGNVYLVARNFGAGNGIFLTRSTDAGSTWGPSGGTLIAS